MPTTVMADLFAKVSCTYCQEEINSVRIQCCVCPDFEICLQCFSAGAEIGPHRNDHSYKFVDHCAVSIFGGKGAWTGKEQLQLLDAVELYGFGNWELVSQHVETRTPEEVKEEYIARYLEGNIGTATWAQLANHRQVLVDHVPEDEGPLSPTVTARLPPLDVTLEEARLLGYKPHRDDYERVSNILMIPFQIIYQLHTSKFVHRLHTNRLRERARRKRIVRDYQLVAKYFANRKELHQKQTLSKEQRDLREKMRVFAQYLSSGEHERLIASIERERELRHRLSELLKYRGLGLTTQEEIIHYEQHAAYERQQQMRQNKSGSSGYATLEFPQKNEKNERADKSFTEERFTWPPPSDGCDTSNCFSSNNSNSDSAPLEPVPLKHFPSGNLLSENEIQLCANLNIQPIHYNTLKALIIQENLLSPGKHRTSSSESDTPDTNIKEAITQYLSYSGWLPGVSVV
nr:transcriptional adapter 2B [Leptinotarsa decemlineata]